VRKLYEKVKDNPDIDIKILTAIFDHQGQVKRMALFKYIKSFGEVDNGELDTAINVLIKKSKIRIDPDTTLRINVDGFNLLKEFFINSFPAVDELSPEEVIVRVILNTEIPTLSKIATKVYQRKIQYVRDLQSLTCSVNEINRILDKYQLTTQPLQDPNNDLEASDQELMDTAKTRQDIEKWKEQVPKSMKLAFKLQLRQFGNDKILQAIYDEIYRYEKWQMQFKKTD
jgi:hypothetical protein